MKWMLRKAAIKDKSWIDKLFIEMFHTIYHKEDVDGYEELKL